MIVYLASPTGQMQCSHLDNMPVLLSYALSGKATYMTKGYQQSFSRILIDSGAFSEFNTGVKVDGAKYKDWYEQWVGHADAIAGLDDMKGDWKQSWKNYEKYGGFPTFHITDPPEFLADLIGLAKSRDKWLGVSMSNQQVVDAKGKEKWLRRCLDKVPSGIHVHGWAMRAFTHVRRLDSVDSTNWFRDAMKLRTLSDLKHLTYSECIEIVVKRYQRWKRDLRSPRKMETLSGEEDYA